MSGLSPSDFNFTAAASGQTSASADSRLLDAAETLVTLQSRGGTRSSRNSEESLASKSRPVYLTPQTSAAYSVMSPQPPTSSSTNMGPPPPPPPAPTSSSASNNVTFVLINQSQTDLMRPPIEPPPRRGGRGRGRGRGSSSSPTERGRGRGRGRGANRAIQAPIERTAEQNEIEMNAEDVEMAEVNTAEFGKEIFKEESTFMVGNLELKDSIFDQILNKKKLELMMDPDIAALLAKHQSTLLRQGVKK